MPKPKSTRRSGGKRKLNEYFKMLIKAKREKKESFTYKGKTYKRVGSDKFPLYKKA